MLALRLSDVAHRPPVLLPGWGSEYRMQTRHFGGYIAPCLASTPPSEGQYSVTTEETRGKCPDHRLRNKAQGWRRSLERQSIRLQCRSAYQAKTRRCRRRYLLRQWLGQALASFPDRS